MIGLAGSVEQRRLNVGGLEDGVVTQDFLVRGAGGGQFEQVRDVKA